jgi:hypothetical protein
LVLSTRSVNRVNDIEVQLTLGHQILSVTCDNASNNDTMVMEMHKKIPAFNKVMRTRCFLHILNLVAKSMLKQFELSKKKSEDFTENEGEVLGDLVELGKDLDIEEFAMWQAEEEDVEVDVTPDDDDEEELDWVEEVQLTEEECLRLREQVKPITRMLIKVYYGILTFKHLLMCFKVRKLAFKIVNSTTKLLPAWKKQLEEIELAICIMPRDVTTRWNSTYDMLSFAYEH